MQKEIVLEARNINKFFYNPTESQVLKKITFEIPKGEFVSVVGKSGCGKSTLLYILSTMDTSYTGELWIDQEMITGSQANYLAKLRNEKIGFVFQFHYLLNEFSVLENIMIPGLKLGKFSREELEHKAMEKLKIFDMEEHALKKANQISGGQKQRVAIARALMNDPVLIMGDEPTGNLDKKNSDIVYNKFKELAQEFRQTLLIVTHDPEFAAGTDRIIEMEDGRVVNS